MYRSIAGARGCEVSPAVGFPRERLDHGRLLDETISTALTRPTMWTLITVSVSRTAFNCDRHYRAKVARMPHGGWLYFAL